MKTLSIAETRRDFCSLAADILENGEPLVISRYGKPCLMITRYSPDLVQTKKNDKPPRCEDLPAFGIWADREDMSDPGDYLHKERNRKRGRLS